MFGILIITERSFIANGPSLNKDMKKVILESKESRYMYITLLLHNILILLNLKIMY